MLDWSQCQSVERTPGKVGGVWLFKGTRVPVKALFENLEGGASIDEFLEWFPGVARDQIEAVLTHAERSLIGGGKGVGSLWGRKRGRESLFAFYGLRSRFSSSKTPDPFSTPPPKA